MTAKCHLLSDVCHFTGCSGLYRVHSWTRRFVLGQPASSYGSPQALGPQLFCHRKRGTSTSACKASREYLQLPGSIPGSFERSPLQEIQELHHRSSWFLFLPLRKAEGQEKSLRADRFVDCAGLRGAKLLGELLGLFWSPPRKVPSHALDSKL